jgi:hypothetical protein
LAEHYIKNENYEKGAKYAGLSGEEAEKTASFPDALAYARKRIVCLERLPKTQETMKKIIDAGRTSAIIILGWTILKKPKIRLNL